MANAAKSRRRPAAAHGKQKAPAAAADPDVAQIVMGLARINDPMFTYLVAMMIDRVPELLTVARKEKRHR